MKRVGESGGYGLLVGPHAAPGRTGGVRRASCRVAFRRGSIVVDSIPGGGWDVRVPED